MQKRPGASTLFRMSNSRRSLVILLAWCLPALAAAQGSLEKPALLTSIGQSSDIAIVKVMLNTQAKLGLDVKPVAKPADLAGVRTLVAVVGASAKGLGAAGIDMDKEIARATALLQAAKAQGAKIVVMHTGGENRRGKTSNDLIDLVVPMADHVVVVAAGNKDRKFQALAAKRNAPVVEVEKMTQAGDAVKALFK
jgi:hypothetical protein